MAELSLVAGAVARLLVVVGGGLSTVMVAYAGIVWMSASGDPQNVSRARGALIGALGGLVVLGVGFLMPRVVDQVVVGPVGGVVLGTEAGVDCDQLLRDQLIFQRGASTADRMNVVIRNIQSRRRECSREVWDPYVDDIGYTVVIKKGTGSGTGACFSVPPEVGGDAVVGDLSVPRGLRIKNDLDLAARKGSGRDADNNIIVYWGNGSRRPNDSAGCWLYIARLRSWGSNY